jgi:hypothetical protein
MPGGPHKKPAAASTWPVRSLTVAHRSCTAYTFPRTSIRYQPIYRLSTRRVMVARTIAAADSRTTSVSGRHQPHKQGCRWALPQAVAAAMSWRTGAPGHRAQSAWARSRCARGLGSHARGGPVKAAPATRQPRACVGEASARGGLLSVAGWYGHRHGTPPVAEAPDSINDLAVTPQ